MHAGTANDGSPMDRSCKESKESTKSRRRSSTLTNGPSDESTERLDVKRRKRPAIEAASDDEELEEDDALRRGSALTCPPGAFSEAVRDATERFTITPFVRWETLSSHEEKVG